MKSVNPNICMVHPNQGDIIETFIDVHRKRLSNVVSVLHGGHMPMFENGSSEPCHELEQSTETLFSATGIPETPLQESAADKLAEYLKSRKVDVVLAEYGPTGVALLTPCRMAGIPLVVHFHGFDASIKVVLEKYRAGYKRLFEEASAIVAVSREMERALLALGAPADRVSVNAYGVNGSMFEGASPKDAPPNFIGVGRFVEKKAPHVTIKAFAKVAGEVADAKLTLAGDGPLRDSCIQLAKDLGIEDRVEFPGPLSHAEVAKLMRSARAYVQHSVTAESGDMEGTPNSILEASASGLPVVSTNHAGIPDAVVHEVTGLLCDEMDIEAMERNLMEMAINPEKAAQMGIAGQNRMTTEYDIDTRLANLSAIINQAVAIRGANS